MATQMEIVTKQLNEKLGEMQKLADFCSEKCDQFVKSSETLENKIEVVLKENKKLHEDNEYLERELQLVKQQCEVLEQYSRKENIQLDGIPQENNENIFDIVNKLSILIDEPITLNNDIQAAHRVPTKKISNIKPIVIRFSNRQKKEAVMKKAKKITLKASQFVSGVPDTMVYVNEHLTPATKEIFFHAKKLKFEKNYKYVWVRDCKVFVRKDDTSRKFIGGN